MEPTIYKPSIYKGAGIYKVGAEGGGGSQPLPENWVRILGIKYGENRPGWCFDLNNVIEESSDDLESIVLYDIEETNYSNNQCSTMNFCFFRGCHLYSKYINITESGVNKTVKAILGNNSTSSEQTITETKTSVTNIYPYSSLREARIKNNVFSFGGNTYSKPYAYETRIIKDLRLFGEVFESGTFAYCGIYDALLKKEDRVIAHAYPVKNTLTGELNFFEEISGNLFVCNLTASEKTKLIEIAY